MHRKVKTYVFCALAVGLIVAIAGCSQATVATVNGEKISHAELSERLMKNVGSQVLDQMIAEKLVLQEARRKGLAVEPGEIDQKLKQIKKQFPSEKAFLKNLEENNLSIEEARQRIEMQLTNQKLLDSEIGVSEKEIADFFKEEKEIRFKGKELSDVRAEIKDQLKVNKRSQASQGWLENLKKKAKIKISL